MRKPKLIYGLERQDKFKGNKSENKRAEIRSKDYSAVHQRGSLLRNCLPMKVLWKSVSLSKTTSGGVSQQQYKLEQT